MGIAKLLQRKIKLRKAELCNGKKTNRKTEKVSSFRVAEFENSQLVIRYKWPRTS